MNSELPGRCLWILSEKIKGREPGRTVKNFLKASQKTNRVSRRVDKCSFFNVIWIPPFSLLATFSRAIMAPLWTRPVYWPQLWENAHLYLTSFRVCLSCVDIAPSRYVWVCPGSVSGLSGLNYHWPLGVCLLHVQPPVSPIWLTALRRHLMGEWKEEGKQTGRDGCHLSQLEGHVLEAQ